MAVMDLPADAHVHSEWSWDTGGPSSTAAGTMEATCRRAVAIGLPALVFTEHLDLEDAWRAAPQDLVEHQRSLIDASGHVVVPPLDVEGYLADVERCRAMFPDLRILTGVEFGQPHLWERRARSLVDLDSLDRVNGSLHTLAWGADRAEPNTLYQVWPAEQVVTAYLEEACRMVAGSEAFAVFTHIDYAVRTWPVHQAGLFDPWRFEEAFRVAMRAIAASGRALEMNTRDLQPWIPQWWAQEGGRAVTFGSDAHTPGDLASGFPEAVAMVERYGFTPGRRPEDFWTR